MKNQYEPKNLKNREGWEKSKSVNTDDYGGAAIHAAAHAMVLLDEGKTPAEAQEIGFQGKQLTGFLAGAAASIVSQCHERGEEFRQYWNAYLGAPADHKGTANPALVTIQTN